MGTSGQIQESSNQNGSTTTAVIREFDTFKNLILAFSITARVRTETVPNDTRIHSYWGSSTEEKLKLLTKYPNSALKCVIKQDGITLF